MEDHGQHLRQHALALASAAEQLAESAGERSSAVHLPAALACIEEALAALGRGLDAAARSLVPAGDPHEPVSRRFARAARDWPHPREGAGPSYERQAQLLASLDTAGASLRAASGDCGRARELVRGTMDPPVERPRLHAASSASA